MIYNTNYYYAPQYEFVSVNQHGNRYKEKRSKKIVVARLSCERTNASGMSDLIVIGHQLNVPVHYDFTDQTAFIEIMSADTIRSLE